VDKPHPQKKNDEEIGKKKDKTSIGGSAGGREKERVEQLRMEKKIVTEKKGRTL